MSQVMDILQDTTLTYRQQLNSLAAYADNAAERLDYGSKARQMMKDGLICDLFEGELPYRPRYILPDYAKLMREGCEFLSLKPPTTIWEAIHTLLIFYEHVPSITTFPVYLGNIDTLLDPFVSNETEAYAAIRLFLQHIDRTLTDSFVHANIGPRETPAGRLILRASKELQCSIPNITLKYDPAITSESFALLAADTALACAKPSFCDHQQYIADFGTEDYAIASCYNGFPIGGGGYTLIRLLLSHVAATASSVEDFFQHSLPEAAGQILHIIDVRSRFIRNDCAFFQSSFLVKEGFIQPDRFAGMLGVVGLAEAVNTLLKPSCQQERFGYGKAANALGLRIIDTLSKMVREHTCEVVGCNSGSHYLHAQVGSDIDEGFSPGCRIPVGEEPDLLDHILQSAPFHRYFPNGIGDVFIFEETYQKHPEALLRIIHGAFRNGLRYFSAYGAGGDLVRVTGYLAKRSDVERLERGEAVTNDTTIFAKGAKHNGHAFDRRIRRFPDED
jgi:YjjI family glycine radical enzyme